MNKVNESKELKAFKEIWYGNKTAENFKIVSDGLEALDAIRNMNIIHPMKCTGSIHQVSIPQTTFYVSEARYNLLNNVLIGGK